MRSGKILVVGRGAAGKSTLVGALAENATNLQVGGRTVAMDHATLRKDGIVLHLVGVPGQERFAGVREALARGAAGAIWVHPAEDLAPDPGTVSLLASLAALPYLVCVNRRNGQRPWEALRVNGFVTLSQLPPPSSVLCGDVSRADDGFRDELTRETWGLLRRPMD